MVLFGYSISGQQANWFLKKTVCERPTEVPICMLPHNHSETIGNTNINKSPTSGRKIAQSLSCVKTIMSCQCSLNPTRLIFMTAYNNLSRKGWGYLMIWFHGVRCGFYSLCDILDTPSPNCTVSMDFAILSGFNQGIFCFKQKSQRPVISIR